MNSWKAPLVAEPGQTRGGGFPVKSILVRSEHDSAILEQSFSMYFITYFGIYSAAGENFCNIFVDIMDFHWLNVVLEW